MIDYYQEEEERQIRKHKSFLREFFLRMLRTDYGLLRERNDDSIIKEICTSLEKEQFEFLKQRKDELFEGKQAEVMNPVINEFIDHVEYCSDIELYIYDDIITVPNIRVATEQ